ncbi:hypothetical protein [Paenibacillus sp. sgz5001063]|uniref:hypothetical protein n=1 Tax=Paenibacillus sp. sgz5001063 TaxID=3242474 RepID=UPI0036D33B45
MPTFRNYTVSNRVSLATFDKNWRRQRVADGHVVYVATANKATVTAIVRGTKNQKLIFKKGQKIIVVGGTFHSAPHTREFV